MVLTSEKRIGRTNKRVIYIKRNKDEESTSITTTRPKRPAKQASIQMLPTPSWLKFKKWRTGRHSAAQREGVSSSGCENRSDCQDATRSKPVQERDERAKGGQEEAARPVATWSDDQEQQPQRTGRRLNFVPRALAGLIERALSPDVACSGSSSSANQRPQSPLRKLRTRKKHQDQVSGGKKQSSDEIEQQQQRSCAEAAEGRRVAAGSERVSHRSLIASERAHQ